MLVVIGIAHGQDYTRRFPFIPGRLTVPEDGTPVPCKPLLMYAYIYTYIQFQTGSMSKCQTLQMY